MTRHRRKIVGVFCYILVVINVFGNTCITPAKYRKLSPMLLSYEQGTLMMSNSPEAVYDTGVLYSDTLMGKGRLLYHHVNESENKNLRFVIIAENKERYAQHIALKKVVHVGPSWSYLAAGQQLLVQYLESLYGEYKELAPYEKTIIYDTETKDWVRHTLLTGMLDIETEGRLQLSFIATEKNLFSIDEMLVQKSLDTDEAPRGTFPDLAINYYLTVPHSGCYQFLLGEKNQWIQGKDGISDLDATNVGNYGIMYHIHIAATEDTTVILCPRGGIYQGTVQWEMKKPYLIQAPHSFKVKKERVVVGRIKKGEVKTVHYMLPNASAAPILLGFEVNGDNERGSIWNGR